MPVEFFIRYQGALYDVGTVLKFHYCNSVIEGTVEDFYGSMVYIRDSNGLLHNFSTSKGTAYFNRLIVKIIKPVYYIGPIPGDDSSKRNCPPSWDVEMGWFYYILVMAVGTLFYARWAIYIIATIIFFAWKNGFLNGGNK